MAFGTGTAQELHKSVEECIAKSDTIAAVFLYVAGKAFVRATAPGGKSVGDGPWVDAVGDTTRRLLEVCLDEMRRLPQPLVGFVDGRVCIVGTALLGACDLVIATRTTDFHLRTAGGSPCTVGVKQAQQVGFIMQVVDGEAQLFDECDNIRTQLLGFTPKSRYAIKQLFPLASTSLLSLVEGERAELGGREGRQVPPSNFSTGGVPPALPCRAHWGPRVRARGGHQEVVQRLSW